MSAIAEILALVNSNVDKTLDELILGEKVFVATPDTILKDLGRYTPINYNTTPTGKGSFIPKLSGTINIRIASPAIGQNVQPETLHLFVFKNNVEIAMHPFSQSGLEETVRLYSVNVEKDAEYSFDVRRTSGGDLSRYYTTPTLGISAIVVDSNYYE